MEELILSPLLLAAFFFIVSAAYSSVGLGGGTSYTALLTIFGASYRAIPTVSLTMNIVVTLMASINYIRAGHARPKLILAFVASSVPMAYLGGRFEVEQWLFQVILIIMLILVAARIYLFREPIFALNLKGKTKILTCLVIGALLGLVSGVVGIGGGIFLVPLIIILGLGNQKQAAATGAVFILLNSLSGLGAHLQRQVPDVTTIAPLIGAVLIGGYLGSYFGSAKFDPALIQRVLGVIILIAIVLLGFRLI